MVIPFILIWLVNYFTKSERSYSNAFNDTLPFIAFYLTLLIFYAMYLSWGRGTWMGFQGAMTFFFFFTMNLFIAKNRKIFFLDFILTGLIMATWYFNFVFVLYKLGAIVIVPSLLIFAMYSFFIFTKSDSRIDALINLVKRFLVIYMFQVIQFISVDYKKLLIYLGIIMILYFLDKKIGGKIYEDKLLPIFISILGLIIVFPILPLVPDQINKDLASVGIIKTDVKTEEEILRSNKYTRQAKMKIDSYKKEAVTGKSARISMWKSGIHWGLANPLLGTGPDTIKEMYPFYRGPEYGRLEGGHNLTPDRLHNEYINTFAATGFLGLLFRYGLVFGTYLVLMVGYLYNNRKNPNFYLLLGTLCGVFLYQGQVLFNFGVVATASLNYMLIGLGLAIGYHNLGNNTEEEMSNE
jgi:hypothetical protein